MKTYPYPQDQIMEYLQEAADNGEVIQLTITAELVLVRRVLLFRQRFIKLVFMEFA